MRKRHVAIVGTVLLAFLSGAPALAQSSTVVQASTTVDNLTLRDTLGVLSQPLGTAAVGQGIGFATALEVATAPFGVASGGFGLKLDKSTGLKVRTATTFGPAFSDRALTSGEGNVTVGMNFINATYDKLGDFSLSQMELSHAPSALPAAARVGTASLALSSQTLVVAATIGATDAMDVGVVVPFVKIKLDGLTWVQNGRGDVLMRAHGGGIASGLGDVAIVGKYRLLTFGAGQPDPGGVAAMVTVRLPTGDEDNLRGLGVTRTLVSVVASAGRGKFKPHANAGYEFWDKGVHAVSNVTGDQTVTARHQIQYAAGIEFGPVPKLTLLLDLVGRQVQGAGRVGSQTFSTTAAASPFGVTGTDAVVAVPDGFSKLTLAPGLKWNLKGTLLLSLNALVSLRHTGLDDSFTPVVGLTWHF